MPNRRFSCNTVQFGGRPLLVNPACALPTHLYRYGSYRQSRGDFIIVGDLMRSVNLLVYKAVDGAIEVGAACYFFLPSCQNGAVEDV